MKLHLRPLAVLSLALVAVTSATRASFIAGAQPRSADVVLVEDGDPYLSFAYFDWGPNWSGVKRVGTATEGKDEVKFRYENTVVSTNVPFVVEGTWKQSAPDTLRFEATITGSKDTELTLAQIGLGPGAAFAGTEGRVTFADGTTAPVKLPLGRGSFPQPVKELALNDKKGRPTLITFDAPVKISFDGQARITLAESRLAANAPQRVAFTAKVPAETRFLSGPGAVGDSTAGWFEFKGASPIPAESVWNMQAWLDAPAGKHGRVVRRDGQLLVGDKPIKLWGLNNSYAACAPENALADRRADFYAAVGINSVRLHKYGDGTGWSGILSANSAVEFDPAMLDRMDYYVAALKKRGIYVKLSPVFIVDVGPADRERVPYATEMLPKDAKPNAWVTMKHGSFYLGTELQDLLIEQVTKLLKHRNPHTGLTYAEDPAIAYVELYNEDSALFGGVNSVMAQSPTLRQRGGAMFAAWLKKKYANEEAFLEAWGPAALNSNVVTDARLPKDESWAENRIYPAGNPWFFDPSNLNTTQRSIKRRLLDTMLFLYELQNSIYDRYAKAIREAGYEGELIASNWQAGRMMSHFYNLHSDARLGTIDRHNYFGGTPRGQRFIFNNASMLAITGGGSLSASLQQVENAPFMLSEWIHVYPNEWGVEGPAIMAAYGMGLQGWDVSYAFQNTDEGTFAPVLGRQDWDVVAPQFLGVFPAVSRQVLRGDVKESSIVHTRNVFIPDLDRENVGFNEDVVQQWDVKTFDSDVFPSRALAAVRGAVRFTDKFEPTPRFDLTPYEKNGGIVSSTDQLFWRAGTKPQDGHITVNSPGTQAMVGFAEGRTAELADATITPRSRFGAIYLTATAPDGRVASGPVLVTAIARARNAGAVIAEDTLLFSPGRQERNRPTGPVVMEPVTAEITLKSSAPATVHILDHNGVRTGRTLPVANGRFTIDTGRDATPYYLIEYGAAPTASR